MNESQLIIELAGMIATAGAIYGAIRADLRAIHDAIAHHEQEIARAHARIDNLFTKGAP